MSEVNVISRTQHIIVEPASGSVSVINAGPPGPNTGIPGPPGVVQNLVAGSGIAIDSNTPASPIISSTQVKTSNIKTTDIGATGAGPLSVPTTPPDIGLYCTSTFYTTAGGALAAGIYGVNVYITANTSDGNEMSVNLSFSGRPHVQTARFLYAAFSMYAEDYLAVGQHITWQVYKHSPMIAFTQLPVCFNMTFRPVNA